RDPSRPRGRPGASVPGRGGKACELRLQGGPRLASGGCVGGAGCAGRRKACLPLQHTRAGVAGAVDWSFAY
ncbi:MAG: hypothetical protein K6T68_13040, partial [Alicyclobacillus shizuokensis]|nr:hypothetical protein [Alicyclobacillus shizuokensis]